MEFKFLKEEEKLFKDISDGIQAVFVKNESDILNMMKVLRTASIYDISDKKMQKYNIFARVRADSLTAWNRGIVMFFRENKIIDDFDAGYTVAIKHVWNDFMQCGLREDEGQLFIGGSGFDYNNMKTVYKKCYPDEISNFLQEQLKNRLKHVMLNVGKGTLFKEDYLEWREERIKMQQMVNKLPELEGIF
jgi:hypothetical protein